MIFAEAGLLTALLMIGGLCSYTDYKSGIVPNQKLLIGIAAGIIFHAISLILGGAPYYPAWLVNMVIADVFAFMMYMGKIWAAGDAKLFMLLYFLIPPQLLDAGTLSYSVIPYFFIFIPAFLFILLDSAVRFIKHEPIKKTVPFRLQKYALSIPVVFIESTAVYCILLLLLAPFIEGNELLLSVLMIVYAYFCSTRDVMKKWYAVLPHATVILICWILGKWTLTIPDWKIYALLSVTILLRRFSGMYNYQQIPTAQVKPGMILSAETVIQFAASKVHDLPHDPSEELTAKINAAEAEAVKRWEHSANGKPNIWIVRKVSFAIMIFLGFVLWMTIRIMG